MALAWCMVGQLVSVHLSLAIIANEQRNDCFKPFPAWPSYLHSGSSRKSIYGHVGVDPCIDLVGSRWPVRRGADP